MKNIPKKENSCPQWLHGKFYQMLKKENIRALYKLSQNIKEMEKIPNALNKASITMIPQPE